MFDRRRRRPIEARKAEWELRVYVWSWLLVLIPCTIQVVRLVLSMF